MSNDTDKPNRHDTGEEYPICIGLQIQDIDILRNFLVACYYYYSLFASSLLKKQKSIGYKQFKDTFHLVKKTVI